MALVKKIFNLTSLGLAVMSLALGALTPAARAAFIVNNTNEALSATISGTYYPLGAVFTMGNYDGFLSNIQLSLAGGSGSVNAYVYNASGGLPTTQLYSLGTVSVAANSITIANPSLDLLAANTSYALVISPGLNWNSTTATNSGGDGTLSGNTAFQPGYGNPDGWSIYYTDENLKMLLTVETAPEVSVTSMMIILGTLTFAADRTLRRKLKA